MHLQIGIFSNVICQYWVLEQKDQNTIAVICILMIFHFKPTYTTKQSRKMYVPTTGIYHSQNTLDAKYLQHIKPRGYSLRMQIRSCYREAKDDDLRSQPPSEGADLYYKRYTTSLMALTRNFSQSQIFVCFDRIANHFDSQLRTNRKTEFSMNDFQTNLDSNIMSLDSDVEILHTY